MTDAAYIGLGSNLARGDTTPPDMLAAARQGLAALPGLRVLAASPVYRTEPQGRKDQAWFHNQALKVALEGWRPPELMRALLDLERRLGRERLPGQAPGGPRVIDLDYLLHGGLRLHDGLVTLPHPRLHERAFVLAPLLDLDPDLALPDGRRLDALLARLDYRLEGHTLWQDG